MQFFKTLIIISISIIFVELLVCCQKDEDQTKKDDTNISNENEFLWGLQRKPLPIKYYLKNINPIHVSKDEFISSFTQATQNWEEQTPLKFKRVFSFDSCDMFINCFQTEPFGGWAGTYWENGVRYKEIGIDNSIKWSLGPTFPPGYFDLTHIIMHEIGHCIELRDLGTGRYNLMDGVLRNGLRTLQKDDLIAFQNFYKMKNETGNISEKINWESIMINRYYSTYYRISNNGKLLVYPILVNNTDDYSLSLNNQPIFPNTTKVYSIVINKKISGKFADTLKVVLIPFINDTLKIYSRGTVNEPEILGLNDTL